MNSPRSRALPRGLADAPTPSASSPVIPGAAVVVACRSMRRVTPHTPISLTDLREMSAARFGDLVKGVVDLERGVMVVDAEMHSDEEAELLSDGSRQQDLWGINLYPDLPEQDWLEFDSMINLRPSSGNQSRSVDDSATRERISEIVRSLVQR